MSEIRTKICDCSDCGHGPAFTCRTFSHRQTDGAGSWEDRYHTFDLCQLCLSDLLCRCLDRLGPVEAKLFLDEQDVKTILS